MRTGYSCLDCSSICLYIYGGHRLKTIALTLEHHVRYIIIEVPLTWLHLVFSIEIWSLIGPCLIFNYTLNLLKQCTTIMPMHDNKGLYFWFLIITAQSSTITLVDRGVKCNLNHWGIRYNILQLLLATFATFWKFLCPKVGHSLYPASKQIFRWNKNVPSSGYRHR